MVPDTQSAPPKNFVTVRLSKEERHRYSQMVRTSVLDLGSGEITAVNAGVLWGKLLQMANGAIYDQDHKWHEIHLRKVDALSKLLESLPRPLIIGYSFVHDIERMQAKLAGVPGVGVIRTNASLDAWKRGEIKVGIMHPASAGHGLNDLKDAAAIVWFGMPSNLEHYQQLNGRVVGGHRRGNREICIHHILTEGTVDDDAKDLLEFKQGQQRTAQIRVAQRLRGIYAQESVS